MKIKFKLLIIFAMCSLLISCTPVEQLADGDSEAVMESADTALLERSEDMGKEYIDSLIFLGESTTYHLKSRGVLSGGKDTTQVWGPENGTINLDSTISTLKIVYPETGEQLSIGEAVAKKKPKIMVLTFGLNGAVQKHQKGEEYFRGCYMRLVSEIRKNSPDTKIILQSCFPIASDMDMSKYSVDAATLNAYICEINGWTQALACDVGCYYLASNETLCDENGFLKDEFDSGDGHHLSVAAYQKILEYIRTHAIKE